MRLVIQKPEKFHFFDKNNGKLIPIMLTNLEGTQLDIRTG